MTAHNLILNTDSYKLTHYLQYPPGTEVATAKLSLLWATATSSARRTEI